MGSRSLRTTLGLDLPLRSLHASGQAQARLLRAADTLAQPRNRMGQPIGKKRRANLRVRLHQITAARPHLQARTRSRTSSHAIFSGTRVLSLIWFSRPRGTWRLYDGRHPQKHWLRRRTLLQRSLDHFKLHESEPRIVGLRAWLRIDDDTDTIKLLAKFNRDGEHRAHESLSDTLSLRGSV